MGGAFDAEAFGFAVAIAMMIVYLIAVILSIVQYVLFSLGLYDTARKRQIRHAWLAWIPVASAWTLGAVADYHASLRGLRRRWRLLLVVLCGAIVVGYLLILAVMIGNVVALTLAGDVVTEEAVLGVFGSVMGAYVVLLLACMAYLPCYTVCLFKIYEEIVPEKAMKYLLLSFLVPLASGICLLRCAKVPVCAEVPQPEGEFIPQDPFALTEGK